MGAYVRAAMTVRPRVASGAGATRSFGDRAADAIAAWGGSWAFVIWFLVCMGLWMAWNALSSPYETFDPYPFILLNLLLSTLAAIQAPIIMMSQRRQEQRQRQSDERHQAADRALARQIGLQTGHTEEMVEAALALLRGEIERKLDDVAFRLDEVVGRVESGRERDDG